MSERQEVFGFGSHKIFEREGEGQNWGHIAFEISIFKAIRGGCYQDRLHLGTTSIEITDRFPPHL